MLSKNNIKFINSLKEKKFRNIHKKFIMEGNKIVQDILKLDSQPIEQLIATKDWMEINNSLINNNIPKIIEAKKDEIKKISSFKTTSDSVLVLNIPQIEIDIYSLYDQLSLVLDKIQDPGNLGTIIRIADWFGIKNIICSEDTADCYNPKVLQASMGSIMRVNVFYTELQSFFIKLSENGDCKVYGTFIEGESVYASPLSKNGLIVLGNESKGINMNLNPYISHKLNIPAFKNSIDTIESLNVSAAAAIVCSEFRRREFR